MANFQASNRETSDLEPHRGATPPCPHFGPCGGCQLQHLTYAAQLDLKASRLRALLEAANLDLPELQFHPSPPLGYRNRIRLTLGVVGGQLHAGYLTAAPDASNLEPRTSIPSFLPIRECPIAAPILWRATEALLALLNQRATEWLEQPPFTVDQLELFTTSDESLLQIMLFVRTSAKSLPAKFTPALASLCESLRSEIPALSGAGIALIPTRSARSRRDEQPRPGPTWGAPGLNYAVPSLQLTTDGSQLAPSFWVPRGAFFQINRFLIPDLLSLVTPNRSGALAWDLYAGVGLFTKPLAPHFARIVAVEIAEPAFTALTSAKLPNRQAFKDTTLDFLRAAVVDRDRPDLVVLDPPRTGAGPETCALLARIAAPTLIYVSCSPETLPADLKILTASGYAISELHLLDLFPQTTHIETVAILTR
jgi:23S rRNA (uracil1939-C5)-methyltransferase